jgi:hypothetical protein
MASKRLETATRFIDHFASLDVQVLEPILAESYIHQYAPSSIPHQGLLDKKSLFDLVTTLKIIMEGYPMKVKQSMESESRNAVTLWASGKAHFRDEFKDDGIPKEAWEYTGEYVFMLYMDETGEKITKTIEFVDSKATTEKFLVLIARAQAKVL